MFTDNKFNPQIMSKIIFHSIIKEFNTLILKSEWKILNYQIIVIIVVLSVYYNSKAPKSFLFVVLV